MDKDNKNEHVRRVRYKGKYPKKFEDKYKELNPEKYGDFAEHIKAKGNTPAGTHISIMVDEILDVLNIKPGENGLDCTFGYGGHSQKMLEKLQGEGHLVSLDIDPIESVKSTKRLRNLGYGEDIHSVELINFSNIDKVCEKYGKFDFILADLGVSSMQIDNPQRGFSYKVDGPLDLRMDPTKGMSAAELLLSLSEDELIGILIENADEPYAIDIAKAVISHKKAGRAVKTTTDFRKIIEGVINKTKLPDKEKKQVAKKSCARCFQALRIEVNHEYEVLYELLEKLPLVLNEGGRVAILTFHSGEDRLVKHSFKSFYNDGQYVDIAKDVIRPSAKECIDNPRAKSTKLRWAVKKSS